MKAPAQYLITSLLMAISLLGVDHAFSLTRTPSRKIYDGFSRLYQRLHPPPPEAREILLVGIDSRTVETMKERWPYPRSVFAEAVRNLTAAGAKVIAFDFGFFGEESPQEDAALGRALHAAGKTLLGAALVPQGGLELSRLPGLPAEASSGIVSKLQDKDGVMRSALTYLVNALSRSHRSRDNRFFSWEMKLLQLARGADLSSLRDEGDHLLISAPEETWKIPVDPVTKAFLIRFTVHSGDLSRLSFYQAVRREFDPRQIQGKIVLIGFLSEMFQDLHRTPIGWIPGITLNANAFLTLCARKFLRPLPLWLEWAGLIAAVMVSSFYMRSMTITRAAPWIALEIALFFLLSFALFWRGVVWNYALLPICLLLIPKRNGMYNLLKRRAP